MASLQETVARELTAEVNRLYAELGAIGAEQAQRKPAPGKWSMEEIVGHLIDSAANNHHRFVRAQEAAPGEPYIGPAYQQEHWVGCQGYGQAPWPELLDLWRLYNLHLARVIVRIPDGMLSTEMRVGDYDPETFGFIIEDCLSHLRLHLGQIRNLLGAVA